MSLDEFFCVARHNGWKMNWVAWKAFILLQCDTGVLDDDSGYEADTMLHAVDAKRAYSACTVGPGKHFIKPGETAVAA